MGKPTFDICKFKTPELEGMESKEPHRALRDPGRRNAVSVLDLQISDEGIRT
jgi:hypothetical protein